jgi:drug/metabolite transporter (DMT)-like permease
MTAVREKRTGPAPFSAWIEWEGEGERFVAGRVVSPLVTGLVLASAAMHASWNALLKGGSDRLRSVTVMAVTTSLLAGLGALFLPAPRAASWGCIALSAALHVVYNLLLVASYRHGDLGVSYPIARGSSPLLVAIGALVAAHERLDVLSLTGVGLISVGIIGLAFESRKVLPSRALVPALLTGATIAAYTLADGMGARLSGHSQAYAAWLFISYGPAMLLILIMWRGHADHFRLDAEAAVSAFGGIVSMAAYAIVIWAASVSPMGPVSALRETGVVFAALLGRIFLDEPLGPRRLAACTIVAMGAACLGYAHR